MREKKWYPVAYMFICTFVMSFMLIGFSKYTKPRVDANRQIAFERAVLSVFDIELPKSNIELHQLFQQAVSMSDSDSGGAYVYSVDNVIEGYAIDLAGQGFWAPIKAILGVSADRKTITGFAVYQQSETPGLGAEIAKPEFLSQFSKDRSREVSYEQPHFEIVPIGSKPAANQVYAITGATQTSTRLEKIINDALDRWINGMAQEQ